MFNKVSHFYTKKQQKELHKRKKNSKVANGITLESSIDLLELRELNL
jgi:hypothetical protein